jgi:hypothetical protein
MAEYYYKKTGERATKSMRNAWMKIPSKSSHPNESNYQREAKNNRQYLAGAKKGGSIKKWATPFYTGKMGL